MRLPLTRPPPPSPFYRKTLQINEARIVSRFGWGLAKTIENHGLAKFKTNLQRVSSPFFATFKRPLTPSQSREGVSHILNMLRQTRLQPMVAGGVPSSPMSENFRVCETPVLPSISATDIQILSNENEERFEIDTKQPENRPGIFSRVSYWFRSS